MTDRPDDGASDTLDSAETLGGLGGQTLEETRAYITRRMQQMAKNACDVYETVTTPGSGKKRNVGAELSAARDIIQMLTEGKVSQPAAPKQSQKPTNVVDLAKLSEDIRKLKQAERRGA